MDKNMQFPDSKDIKPSKCRIDPKYLAIKAHYFFFLGCGSPVLPFMILVARQLGIPVVVQGTVGAIILLLTVIFKPVVSSLADIFSNIRKGLFLFLLTVMVSSFFAIIFLPQIHNYDEIEIQGSIITTIENLSLAMTPRTLNASWNSKELNLFLLSNEDDSCYPQDLWDCSTEVDSLGDVIVVPHILHDEAINLNSSELEFNHRYILENPKYSFLELGVQVNFSCKGGIYMGSGCPSLWTAPLFYLYLILITVAYVSYAICNSISDAICMDLIGENGDYGNQRAWGTVGWGMMGPISGLLIDWYTGENYMKNYLPAFLLLFAFGSTDILLSAWKLKVPRLEKNDDLWKCIGVVMKKPSVIVFLLFVILTGLFNGVVVSYIFVLQEDMATDSSYRRHMKFIQGMTIGVQCFFEAPFMWVCGWFLKKMGSSALLSFVFFLYIFRLFGLALVGSYGPVWATLVIEILNGPCYGFGYTAIVVQSSIIAPPGTSTTVQSITNICFESLGYALASFLGGVVFTVVGSAGIYYVFGSISVVVFILHQLSMAWEKRNKDPLEMKEEPESEPLSGKCLPIESVSSSVTPSDVLLSK